MNLNYQLHGSFDWSIIDETDTVVSSGNRNNLILNQGIDYCFQRSFAENISACALSSLYVTPLKTDTYLQGEFVRTTQVQTNALLNRTSTSVSPGSAGGGFTYPVATVTHTKTFRFPRFSVRTVIGSIGISYSSVSGANLFAKSLIGPAPIAVDAGKYLQLNYSLGITFPSTYNEVISVSQPGYNTLGYLGYFNAPGIQVDSSLSGQSGAWNSYGWNGAQLVGLMGINSNGTISPYQEATSGAYMVTGFVTGMNGSDRILSGLYGTPTGLFNGQACNEPASGALIFLSTNGQSPNISSCSLNRSANSSINGTAIISYLGNGLGVKTATFGRGTAITGVYSWGLGGATNPETNCGYIVVSTGAQYSGSSLVTGRVGNGYPGFTKLSNAELTLQFYYSVSSL